MDFIFGETKNVRIKIISMSECHPFSVTNAKYSLTCGDEEEASGICDICKISQRETILSALISPQRKNGIYNLRYTYDIYPETLIYNVKIRVK